MILYLFETLKSCRDKLLHGMEVRLMLKDILSVEMTDVDFVVDEESLQLAEALAAGCGVLCGGKGKCEVTM